LAARASDGAVKVLALALAAILAQAPTFRSSIDRVQLDVSATRNGRPVSGLTAADFIVTDNGAVQEIESTALEESPLRVQLVLDASGSVSGQRLQRLIVAGTGLMDALRRSDSAGLITFSTAVDIRVPMTRDLEQVKRALGSVQGAGASSLRDAVQLALAMPPAGDARTVIIVFSDGADTSSWLSDAEVVEAARWSGVVIHMVAVRAGTVTSRFIPDVTDAAGGRVFSAASTDDLGPAVHERARRDASAVSGHLRAALADSWLARAQGERQEGWRRRESPSRVLREQPEVTGCAPMRVSLCSACPPRRR
jgi:VWFA-related protein